MLKLSRVRRAPYTDRKSKSQEAFTEAHTSPHLTQDYNFKTQFWFDILGTPRGKYIIKFDWGPAKHVRQTSPASKSSRHTQQTSPASKSSKQVQQARPANTPSTQVQQESLASKSSKQIQQESPANTSSKQVQQASPAGKD